MMHTLRSLWNAGEGNNESPSGEPVIVGAGHRETCASACLPSNIQSACFIMLYTRNLHTSHVSHINITELVSPDLTDEEKGDFESFSHNPETDSIFVVSSKGCTENLIPNYATSPNMPSQLSSICLKYHGTKSLHTLRQAITGRLFGKKPTIGSIQPDGSFTFFFELTEQLALPQDRQQAEGTLKAWMNTHGLSHIGGARLDKEHFLAQLVQPTFIGDIQYRTQSTLPLQEDTLFVHCLSRELSVGTLRIDTKQLLTRMHEQGWWWKSDGAFAPGCIGELESAEHSRTVAIVTASGFRSLGKTKAVYSFSDLIGSGRWATLVENEQNAAVQESFFYQEMGKEHYIIIAEGKCRKCTYTEFSACLRQMYKLGNNEFYKALNQIIVDKKVHGARCCMYEAKRLINREGRLYINTSDVRVLPPNEDAPSDRFKASCPAISKLLHTLFGAKSDELKVLLAWLAIAYQGAYYGRPQRGQALYVVGAPGTGKTLLRELIGELFGRSCSGHEFFCETSPFNAYALEDNPLVYLDDTTIDWRRCNQMHNRIKELVATGTAVLNGKYESQRQVEWSGRIMVLCNPTGEGRKLIPEVNADNRDKLIVLQTKDTILKDQKLGAMARQELPAFAHFLKHYRSPLMKAECRFGMEAYVSPAMREATLFRNGEDVLMECLSKLLDSAENAPTEQDYTISELYSKLSEQNLFGQTEALCTAKNLGVKLAKICEAITCKVVEFPYTITTRRTSARRSWVFTPQTQEPGNH